MFKKYICIAAALLFTYSPAPAQQDSSPIKSIYLIHNPAEKHTSAPQEIRLGIETSESAYFKLTRDGDLIAAGLFPEGENSLSLPATSFFEKTAKHTFLLEVKTDRIILQKSLFIDVQLAVLESPEPVQPDEDLFDRRISLYVENKLLSSRIIHPPPPVQIQKDLPPLPKNYDPFKPKLDDDLMSSAVSILDAIGLAYHLIKSVVPKKDKEDSSVTLQHTPYYSTKFLRRNSQGEEEEVIAMIGLTTK